ncbi:MAG: hypothetical protein HN704_11420 [Bacteroidetes bacterium]|jgi:outer membrane protein assembly factor BamD (BamD/ComL family)|nr:hypothetical protein [Bacteroidota bacterium]MBT6685233.1 hypothetical protein [Bacteroidota bacterium]MBT7144381.1 hypothetical protein [Bacteroidota bacterium]MBT7492202.1 hypothetical protein [Bacteroidota bacterium]
MLNRLRFFVPVILLIFISCTTKKEYEKAQSINTIYAYEDFIKKHPKSKYDAEATKTLLELYEKTEWEKTRSFNTIEAYYEFLSIYPTSYYAKIAKEKILRLEENRDWKAALKSNKIYDFYNFMKNHPKSRFIEDAKRKTNTKDPVIIEDFEVEKEESELMIEKYMNIYFKDSIVNVKKRSFTNYATIEAYWLRIKELNYREGYLDFLYNYSNSIFANEAITKIREIEFDEWDLVRQINTAPAYVKYLKKFSNSEYAEIAVKKIIDFKVDEIFHVNNSKLPAFVELTQTNTITTNTIEIYNKSEYPLTLLASSPTQSLKVDFFPYQLKSFELQNEKYKIVIMGKNLANFITEINLRGGKYQMQFEIPE